MGVDKGSDLSDQVDLGIFFSTVLSERRALAAAWQ